MSKEELKKYIQNLQLPDELESLLYELIDGAKEVNQELLNAVADVLDMQAEFYEKEADALQAEASEYDDLAVELDALDEEEYQARTEAVKESQESVLTDIKAKLDTSTEEVESDQVNNINEELKHMSSNQGDQRPVEDNKDD